MKIILIVLSIMVLGIFLISCTRQQDSTATDQITVDAEFPLMEEANASLDALFNESMMESTTISGECSNQWRCISSTMRGYQYENCSIGERRVCKFGCDNDTCKPAPICDVGLRCITSTLKGYQLEDCSVISEVRCEYGCENAECLPRPNITEQPQQQSSPPPPVDNSVMISVSETQTIQSGDLEHNLSIYIIDEGQVRLMIDGRKSDWLTEGQGFATQGVNVTVMEILFQRYGTKTVRYRVE